MIEQSSQIQSIAGSITNPITSLRPQKNRANAIAVLSACMMLVTGGCASESARAASDATKASSSQSVAPITSAPVATEADYTRVCGICHLQNGEGVPGAFPPLNERLATLGDSDAGRNYLVGLLNNGLYGSITAGGTSYSGAMPPITGQLDAAGMAGMLNYVMRTFAGTETGFSADEITRRATAIGSTPGAKLREPVSADLK